MVLDHGRLVELGTHEELIPCELLLPSADGTAGINKMQRSADSSTAGSQLRFHFLAGNPRQPAHYAMLLHELGGCLVETSASDSTWYAV